MRTAILVLTALALSACNPTAPGGEPVCHEGDQTCNPGPDLVLD